MNQKPPKAPRQTASMRYLEMARNRGDRLARKLAETKRELTTAKTRLKNQETDRTLVMTRSIRELRAVIAERDFTIEQLKTDLANARKEAMDNLIKVVGLQKSLVELMDKNRRLVKALEGLET